MQWENVYNYYRIIHWNIALNIELVSKLNFRVEFSYQYRLPTYISCVSSPVTTVRYLKCNFFFAVSIETNRLLKSLSQIILIQLKQPWNLGSHKKIEKKTHEFESLSIKYLLRFVAYFCLFCWNFSRIIYVRDISIFPLSNELMWFPNDFVDIVCRSIYAFVFFYLFIWRKKQLKMKNTYKSLNIYVFSPISKRFYLFCEFHFD